MPDDIQIDGKLVEAFHLMYDNFPEAVQLKHKSKRIVALNSASGKIGRHVGLACAEHGPPESHHGCLAARAVKEHTTKWLIKEDPKGNTSRFSGCRCRSILIFTFISVLVNLCSM